MTDEIWKPIPGFPKYEVSNLGRVKSYKRSNWPRLLKATVNADGYSVLKLVDSENRSVTKGPHQLVMLAFVGPCPEGMEVCHEDGNPKNNRLSNLKYDTHRNNMQDARTLRRIRRKMLSGEILVG